MRKKTASGCTPISLFYRFPRLMQVLSILSGLSVLSSGLVIAQTDSPIDRGGTNPSTSVESAPAPEPPVSSKSRSEAEPIAPARSSVPERVAPEPPPAPAAYSEPSSSYREPKPTYSEPSSSYREPKPTYSEPSSSYREPEAPAPTVTVPKQRSLSAPNLSVPNSESEAKPPKLYANPAQENPEVPFNATNRYIDRTDYNIGATRGNEGQPSVIVTDRSTGCRTVSQNGQLSSGVCDVALPSPQVATEQLPTQPIISQPIVGQQLQRRLAGSPQSPNANNPNYVLQEPQLAGVTQLPATAIAALKSVNPGIVNPGRVNPGVVEMGAPIQMPYSEYSTETLPPTTGWSYLPSITPSGATGMAYYNLTPRPAGRPNIGNANFMFPLAIPGAITSLFGWRIHPITGDQRFHAGTDIGAPAGTPVLAAVAGQVITADFMGGYGLTVVVQHPDGNNISLYAHLSEIFVRPGDRVEQGNVIGRVGSTGNSTGPHLHFEWRHQTPDGWVAMDAGVNIQYSLAQFMKSLQVAQSIPQPVPQIAPQVTGQTVPQIAPQVTGQTAPQIAPQVTRQQISLRGL
jgi:murein DD-endopeptidase MepM/ murein hydrolase activator NlpD